MDSKLLFFLNALGFGVKGLKLIVFVSKLGGKHI